MVHCYLLLIIKMPHSRNNQLQHLTGYVLICNEFRTKGTYQQWLIIGHDQDRRGAASELARTTATDHKVQGVSLGSFPQGTPRYWGRSLLGLLVKSKCRTALFTIIQG